MLDPLESIGSTDRSLDRSQCAGAGSNMVPRIYFRGVLIRQSFQACITIGCCPMHFRRSITVSIRKPGRPAGAVKSYRPIALLSTIGKTMESIMANRLAWAAEE